MEKLKVSVLICAYNEAKTIAKTLQSVIEQCLKHVEITEIIVVSSGSTDGTNIIVESFKDYDSRIKLITEDKRNGKAAAINLFLSKAKEDICCMISADVVLHSDTIERLCVPFRNPEIGMTGARLIALTDTNTFWGYYGKMLEYTLDARSRQSPKLGEAIAFRKIERIDPTTAVDESYIEAIITKLKMKLVYVPEATFNNSYATNYKDFKSQRVRIHLGHLRLKQDTGYEVSTIAYKPKVRIIFNYIMLQIKHLVWIPAIILIEQTFVIRAYLKFKFTKENPYIWNMVKTSKNIEANKEKVIV